MRGTLINTGDSQCVKSFTCTSRGTIEIDIEEGAMQRMPLVLTLSDAATLGAEGNTEDTGLWSSRGKTPRGAGSTSR